MSMGRKNGEKIYYSGIHRHFFMLRRIQYGRNVYIKRHSPPSKFIKTNFDMSKTNQGVMVGFIIQDFIGRILLIAPSNVEETSVIIGEAMGCCQHDH